MKKKDMQRTFDAFYDLACREKGIIVSKNNSEKKRYVLNKINPLIEKLEITNFNWEFVTFTRALAYIILHEPVRVQPNWLGAIAFCYNLEIKNNDVEYRAGSWVWKNEDFNR